MFLFADFADSNGIRCMSMSFLPHEMTPRTVQFYVGSSASKMLYRLGKTARGGSPDQ